MSVKHWSFAGLLLTYWCNARCASCYLCCGPQRHEEMSVEDALGFWAGLQAACPHGCRIHLSGGEPFGDWPRLICLCRRAAAETLGPLEKVETNAFWADGPQIVRDRLRALDASGMGKLVISTDPYHQEFVPISRCRLAARVAEEVLGARRVQVRWRDWLAEGFDTAGLDDSQRAALFARYASAGKDRLTGRAADALAGNLPCMSAGNFADRPCKERLLRSRHVHIDGGGRMMPGVCAGIVLGVAGRESVSDVWRRLAADHNRRPIVAALAERGPVGLLPLAERTGFAPQAGYAGKCHLCWQIRRHLSQTGLYEEELAPAWMYETQADAAPVGRGRPAWEPDANARKDPGVP